MAKGDLPIEERKKLAQKDDLEETTDRSLQTN
jgi:hypothetical protein